MLSSRLHFHVYLEPFPAEGDDIEAQPDEGYDFKAQPDAGYDIEAQLDEGSDIEAPPDKGDDIEAQLEKEPTDPGTIPGLDESAAFEGVKTTVGAWLQDREPEPVPRSDGSTSVRSDRMISVGATILEVEVPEEEYVKSLNNKMEEITSEIDNIISEVSNINSDYNKNPEGL